MGFFDRFKEKFEEKINRGDFQWIADLAEKADKKTDIIDRRVNRRIDKIAQPILKAGDKIDATLGIGDHKYSTVEERLKVVLGTKKNEKKYSPEYGDIIGVSRVAYEHYGLYVGGGRVIHYTSYSGNISDNTIMETDISHFLNGSNEFFIFDCENEGRERVVASSSSSVAKSLNMTKPFDEVLVIYTPEEAVERAKSRLGENKYSLSCNNCEHFAIWCKTDISKSYQVDRILKEGSKHTIGI